MKVKCWGSFSFADKGRMAELSCVREFPGILPPGTLVWFETPWGDDVGDPFGLLVQHYILNDDGELTCRMTDLDGSDRIDMAGSREEDLPLLIEAGWNVDR